MSAKSRARGRFDPPAEPAMSAAEEQQIGDVVDAFELADINPRAGISKWVGAVLGARERAGENSAEAENPAENMPQNMPAAARALREPSPFEKAILGGMTRKPMYGGTVEPWRVEQRRRRNRAARKARRLNRRVAQQ